MSADTPLDQAELLRWTTSIVSSHVRNAAIPVDDMTDLIATVHASLAALGNGPVEEPPKPAVPINKSITPDYIICLEDGRKLKTLKRHLNSAYNMTPEEYRKRWGLPADYPMVAPNYAKRRSALAKQIGLGRRA